jgi:hypothetical protein
METFAISKMRTLMPRVVTIRDIIRGVPERYRDQYPDDREQAGGRNTGSTYAKLTALDLETATVKDIANIIGNDSWTRLECSVCELDREAVVEVPREYSQPLTVCAVCANGVAKMLAEIGQ